jgi:hypothetical protein
VALRGERGPRPERISDDGRVVSVHRPLWASASDRPVPARPASGEHAKAFTPAAGAGLRPIGLADSRSPAVASSTGFVRPTPTAPFTPDPGAPSAVKPVSSASVSRDRVVPPGLTGNESKPYSIRRGPAVDNASPRTTVPERTPPVVRQPAVSSSLADRPSQPPLSPVKGVTPGAPRLDAASAVSVPPSPTRGGAGSKVPVSSRSAVPSVQPSVSPSAPKTAPGPSFASPGRPVAPAVMPRNDVPRAAVPAASGPPSAGRVYASTAPVAPRVSAPGTAAPTPSRGGGGGASMPSIFSPARSQGGRSTGGADLSSAGKSGR